MRIAALTEPLAVACHDVRRAELVAGETALVIGGGPIGLLVALVARATGARVLVSEVNPAASQLRARSASRRSTRARTTSPSTSPR